MASDQDSAELVPQRLPFIAAKESKEFMAELILALIREIDRRRHKHVPQENLQIFYHGTGWSFQREETDGFSSKKGTLELQRVQCSIGVDRILKNDVGQISDFIRETSEKFEEAFEQRLFTEMESVVTETGNTISISEAGSLKDAAKRIISSAHLSVNADGTISRPTLYLNPATMEKIQNMQRSGELENDPEIELLWIQKEEEARQRESIRLARYQRAE